MARRIEDIFNECLERINRGESIEKCLQDYPEVARELDQMLRTSLNITWRSSLVKPRAEFKKKARAQFVRAITEQNLATHYNAMQRRYGKRSSIFGLHRILAPVLTALAVVIVIGGAGTATAAAATGAMPEQALYPVKLATEQIRLTLTFSDTDKAILNAQIAETRSKEIQVMADQGKTDQVILAVERMFINLENTNLAVSRIMEAEGTVLTTEPAAPGTATTALPRPLPAVTEPSSSNIPQVTPDQPVEEPTLAATVEPTVEASDDTAKGVNVQQGTDKTQVSRTAKLKKLLQVSIDGNLNQLELALKNAPENAKPYIENAIKVTKDKRAKIWAELPDNGNHENNDQDNEKSSENNTQNKQTGTSYQMDINSENETSLNEDTPALPEIRHFHKHINDANAKNKAEEDDDN